MQAQQQIAMFTLYHRGVPVTFSPTDPAALPAHFTALAAAIDTALAAGWATGPEGEGAPDDGRERRQVVISGWVYGKSLNGIPLVWLYSDHFPYLSHKVCQVYQERIKELPGVIIPKDLKPLKGQAPEKKAAIEDGDFHPCEPFTVEIVDTGEMFGEYKVFKFERVIPAAKPSPVVAQPAPVATPAPTPTQTQPAAIKPAPANGQAETGVDEKALLLVAYERLGVEVFGANDWPQISRERALTASGRKTQNVADLAVGQLQAMLKALQSNQQARAAKAKITPPPTGK